MHLNQFSQDGIVESELSYNLTPARLYELAIRRERAVMTSSGALATFSGKKTGRSPKDKRIVVHPESVGEVSWGLVNTPVSRERFLACRSEAVDFIHSRPTMRPRRYAPQAPCPERSGPGPRVESFEEIRQFIYIGHVCTSVT
jgi:ATP-dependent phosphoenolpyruvate carboxykinase